MDEIGYGEGIAMRAMILAAGEGRRMRPLTADCPKPLLKIDKHSLIEHQIFKLVKAGIKEIVVNTAYLGPMIEAALGGGERYGVKLVYSREPDMLETGGAINHAQEVLGDAPFLLVNGDVWAEVDYSVLINKPAPQPVYLVLVENPDHNRGGDFALTSSGKVTIPNGVEETAYTFSGVSIIDPNYFFSYPKLTRKFPLRDFFRWAIEQGRVSGEVYEGVWIDVGTPERLAQVKEHLVVN